MYIKSISIINKMNGKEFSNNSFIRGFNFILSEKNSKGKTIISTAIEYTLGGNVSFPKGFLPAEHEFILECEHDNTDIVIYRHKNKFLVSINDKIHPCADQSDFSNVWNNEIFNIGFVKRRNHIQNGVTYVGFLHELFTVHQEMKDSTKVLHSLSIYTKESIFELISLLKGNYSNSDSDMKLLKEKKKQKKKQMKEFEELEKKIREDDGLKNYNDKEHKSIKVETTKLAEIKSKMKKKIIIKNKVESLITDFSLQKAKEIKFICNNCNSSEISVLYKNFNFPIATDLQRKKLLEILNRDLNEIDKEIISLSAEMNIIEKKLSNLSNADIDYISTLKFLELQKKYKLLDYREISLDLERINLEIGKIEKENINIQKDLKKMVSDINEMCKKMVPDWGVHENIIAESLYTKQSYGGANLLMFLVARIIVINNYFDHTYFPIIIDGILDQQLDVDRYDYLMDELRNMNEQKIIFSKIDDSLNLELLKCNKIFIDSSMLLSSETKDFDRIYDSKFESIKRT